MLTVETSWKEPNIAHSWNKALIDSRSHGIYRGFGVQAGPNNTVDVINHDLLSSACIVHNELVLTVRSNATENIDVSPKATTQYLVIDGVFIIGGDTTPTLEVVDSVIDRYVILCALNVPLGTTTIDASMIDFSPRQWCSDITKNIARKKRRATEYGNNFFVNDAFQVQDVGGQWDVKLGDGYCNGHAITLDANQEDLSIIADGDIYIDSSILPKAASEECQFTIASAASAPASYVDAFGITHEITTLATHESTGDTVEDKRSFGTGMLRSANNFFKKHTTKCTREYGDFDAIVGSIGTILTPFNYVVTPMQAGHKMDITWIVYWEGHHDVRFVGLRDIGEGPEVLPFADNGLGDNDPQYCIGAGIYDHDLNTTAIGYTYPITDYNCVDVETTYSLAIRAAAPFTIYANYSPSTGPNNEYHMSSIKCEEYS